MNAMTLQRRLVGEMLGTALLLIAIVGSGIMGERLANGNTALALLANSLATGGALIALILTFGPISGAHFNPIVTLAFAWRDRLPWCDVLPYVVAQFFGAWFGVLVAHIMFAQPVFELSVKDRSGINFIVSEGVATFGLLIVIFSGEKFKPESIPYAVAAYIMGAYWFTSSTSFANPAVTLARAFTDSFAGIRLESVLPFMFAQIVGMITAIALFDWLVRAPKMGAWDLK